MSQTGFLPSGIHSIRFFTDPTGQYYQTQVAHRVQERYVLCPRALENNPVGGIQACELCTKSFVDKDWRLKGRYFCMVYGHLISTDAQEEFWQSGTTCRIIGSRPLEIFFNGLTDSQLNQIISVPQKLGPVTQVSFTEINSCPRRLSTCPANIHSIVNTGKWYVPLSTLPLSEEFDPIHMYGSDDYWFLKYSTLSVCEPVVAQKRRGRPSKQS